MHSTSIDSNSSRNFMDYALEQEFGDIHCTIDSKTGLQAIIAIHNTNLGPALGGCRFVPYADTNAAMYDAMRLAKGMSYKSAIANLPLGGGKAVIIEPKHQYDRQAYMQQFAKFVESLNGRYITALDSGTNLDDMNIISQHTSYIASMPQENGDPAPSTANVVFRGIQSAILFKLDRTSLTNIHVAIQGLGNVGYLLAKHLHDHGAKLSVADINPTLVERVVREFGATAIDINKIHAVPCDVFAPCALGSILNDQSIRELQTNIIAGAANNQCQHNLIAQQLHENNILYAPDYVINAGGVIFAAHKYLKTTEIQLQQKFDQIYDVLLNIFYTSAKTNQSTLVIANDIAHKRLNGINV